MIPCEMFLRDNLSNARIISLLDSVRGIFLWPWGCILKILVTLVTLPRYY